MSLPRGWHHRGYLPHADLPRLHAITYRLADALPDQVAQAMRGELADRPDARPELRRRVDRWCDAGHGACLLRRDEVAEVVVDAWRHFDGERYRLGAFVVMPNHVHVLVELRDGHSLSDVVGGWKSWTARRISALAQVQPPIWQADYWDRFIRDEVHLQRTVEYIHGNPVRAGLCADPPAWRWSSAFLVARASSPGRPPGRPRPGVC